MTIVIALKVGDGVVLGADSASTIFDAAGVYVVKSYFNAEKLFNLVKGLPIGMLTYGLGGLSGRSMSSLAKDLRKRFTDAAQPTWYVDQTNYTVEQVAQRVRAFFYDELYVPELGGAAKKPTLGFLVAGYSANASSSEVWKVFVDQTGACAAPQVAVRKEDGWGVLWEGQIEACFRILKGYSPQIAQRLVAAGMTEEQAQELLGTVEPLVHSGMPIQDVLDLVHFLVDTSSKFVRFAPGAFTVAEPIDIAAITPHEGFRWVRRKHYYSAALNPPLS
jgi:hypothetical protein